MIKAGISFIVAAVVLYFVSFFFLVDLPDDEMFGVTLLISSYVIAAIGSLMILVQVLKDRLKDKKEEDEDDLSQY